MDLEHFIEESAFAKVVRTAKGDALMVAGRVIQFAEGEEEMIDFISIALRRAGRTPQSNDIGVGLSGGGYLGGGTWRRSVFKFSAIQFRAG